MLVDADAPCNQFPITNTLQIDSLVDPTLSIDASSDITETVLGPLCTYLYLPIVTKNY
jgi:hypothetical protein